MLTLTGKVVKGAMILDEPATLPEGARLSIRVIPASEKTLGEALREVSGRLTDLPPNASQRVDEFPDGFPLKGE